MATLTRKWNYILLFALIICILPFATSILNTSIISYYDFSTVEGGALADLVGNRNLNIVGATGLIPAKLGTAYRFDGINDYMDSNATYSFTWATNMSLMFWMNGSHQPAHPDTALFDRDSNNKFLIQPSYSVAPYNTVIERGTGAGAWVIPPCYTYINLTNGTYHNVVVTIDDVANNISVWDNGVFKINCTAAFSIPTTLTNITLGARYNLISGFYNGTIDEFAIWNRTLSTDEIAQIYNSGSGIPYMAYYNYTELVTPNNTTHYNLADWPGYIWIHTGLYSTCNINDKNFTETSLLNVTDHIYEWLTPTEGNHSIIITCNNTPSINFWFIYDETNPVILQTKPEDDNSTIINASNMNVTLDVSANDQYLYLFNLTIRNNSGYIMYNNYSGVLTTPPYIYQVYQNLSNFTPGTYHMLVEATDSHTSNKIDGFSPILKQNKIKYKSTPDFGNIDFEISLIDSDIPIKEVRDYKLKDRHSPRFGFNGNDNKVHEYTFRITSSHKLDYIENSEFIGHFVAVDGMVGIWYDSMFAGYEGSEFEIQQISDYEYDITIKTKLTQIDFNSLGGLNYANLSSTFEIYSNISIYVYDISTSTYLTDFTILSEYSDGYTQQNTTTNVTTFSLKPGLPVNFTLSKYNYEQINIPDIFVLTYNPSQNYTINVTQSGVSVTNLNFRRQGAPFTTSGIITKHFTTASGTVNMTTYNFTASSLTITTSTYTTDRVYISFNINALNNWSQYYEFKNDGQVVTDYLEVINQTNWYAYMQTVETSNAVIDDVYVRLYMSTENVSSTEKEHMLIGQRLSVSDPENPILFYANRGTQVVIQATKTGYQPKTVTTWIGDSSYDTNNPIKIMMEPTNLLFPDQYYLLGLPNPYNQNHSSVSIQAYAIGADRILLNTDFRNTNHLMNYTLTNPTLYRFQKKLLKAVDYTDGSNFTVYLYDYTTKTQLASYLVIYKPLTSNQTNLFTDIVETEEDEKTFTIVFLAIIILFAFSIRLMFKSNTWVGPVFYQIGLVILVIYNPWYLTIFGLLGLQYILLGFRKVIE